MFFQVFFSNSKFYSIEACLHWVNRTSVDVPSGAAAYSSRHWQRPLVELRHELLLSQLHSARDVARLHAVSTPEAASLYFGLPSTRDGTRLSDPELSIAIGMRLGLPVAAHAICACGTELDVLGDHALTCNFGVERFRRHNEVNLRIRNSLNEAGFPAVLEPVGVSARDSRRFDGVTVAAFECGRPMAWDATIIHTCAPSHLKTAVSAAGDAASAAESLKRQRYADLNGRFDFRAVGMETLGAFGPQALELVASVASRVRSFTGEQSARLRITRRLAAAIQAGNARTIIAAHASMLHERFAGAFQLLA